MKILASIIIEYPGNGQRKPSTINKSLDRVLGTLLNAVENGDLCFTIGADVQPVDYKITVSEIREGGSNQ